MRLHTANGDDSAPPNRPPRGGHYLSGIVPALIAAALLAGPIFVWFFCRIEPGPGQIAVLIHKTGRDLPSGQILALEPDQKGIQLDVLPEGRYFRNPYSWAWQMQMITDIPAGKLGVLTRLYGDDLPPNQIIAGDQTKGIVADVLGPGKHRVNPYAYNVQMVDAITVKPGSVGVVVSLVGADVLSTNLPAKTTAAFLVAGDMKGIRPQVLDPGTYYLNPFLFDVVEVTLQSQRFEMSGDDAINFLTMDGFTVVVEGTIEFAILRDKASLLTHRVGDMSDIIKKVILPRARGFSRIEGSKHPAINFIVGETRQQFQNDLEQHLRTKCEDWGVAIKSVLIRNIIPPDDVASIIREREIAVQNSKKIEQEIEQAKSKAQLVRQEVLAVQSKEKVDADTARIRAVIVAKQEQAVRLVAAQKDLGVARLENEAAEAQAQATVLKAKGEGDVIRMKNEAEAQVIRSQSQAFGTGLLYARNVFYRKLGPRIDSVLTSDQSPGLGGLFTPYLPSGKEGPR